MFKKVSFLLLLILLCLSCGDEFTEQSKLGKLRVLAMRADTPEINAAATVTVTPLISFVDGGDTTLNYNWEACPDPGIDFGADINCDSATAALKLTGSGSFNTNSLSGTQYTGNADNISLNIPAAVFTYLGTLDSDLQFNGVDYLLILNYTDATSGQKTTGLKRIRLSTKSAGELNTNPTLGAIQFDGVDIAAFPSKEGVIKVSNLSAAQTYSNQTNVGLRTFSENMYVSWYASTGEFLFNRTDIGEDNTYTPSGTSGVFVAVYRDGRGGVVTVLNNF